MTRKLKHWPQAGHYVRVPSKRPDTKRYTGYRVVGSFRTTERKDEIDAKLRQHDMGVFNQSALLVDELLTDDRIQGVSDTRASALLSCQIGVIPADDKRKSRKIAEEIVPANGHGGLWDDIAPPAMLREILKWGYHLGAHVSQIVWQRTAKKWVPRLVPMHPQYLRWDTWKRTFVLQTEQGEVEIPRVDENPYSDGKWFVWCPAGVEYGWRSGLIRTLADKYIMRQWNFRDWARYNERHGLALLVAKFPGGATEEEKNSFFDSIESMGSEAVVSAPQGDTKDQPGFDIEIREAVARSWEAFREFKAELDKDIAISIAGQNLTTEVQGGSRAAAQVHDLVRLDKAIEDASLGPAISKQVLSWYCLYNYGDRDLAPTVRHEVEPPADERVEAESLLALGNALNALKAASARVDIDAILEEHGVPLLDESEMPDEPEPVAPPPPPNGEGEDEDKAEDKDDGEPDPKEPGEDTEEPGENEEGGQDGQEETEEKAAQMRDSAVEDALMKLVQLRSGATGRKTSAGSKRAAKYQDRLIANGIRKGVRALAPDLASLRAEIDKADSFNDLKMRIIMRFSKSMDPRRLASVIAKANLLAKLMGRYQALVEA